LLFGFSATSLWSTGVGGVQLLSQHDPKQAFTVAAGSAVAAASTYLLGRTYEKNFQGVILFPDPASMGPSPLENFMAMAPGKLKTAFGKFMENHICSESDPNWVEKYPYLVDRLAARTGYSPEAINEELVRVSEGADFSHLTWDRALEHIKTAFAENRPEGPSP
jgi:hypothetical protein